MAISDPTMSVPTPTGILQGVAAFNWDGAVWQPVGRAGPSVPTPTGILQGVAAFTGGPSWAPPGRAGPGVATPTGVLDGVAVYTWSGSQWTPPGGSPTPSTSTGALRGVAAFDWDGTTWQPAGQAGPDVPTPYGVLQGVARFNWTGTAWAAVGAPSLSLDFMTPGTLDSRITFTRASTATYTDASGTIQTAAANAPRWDYAGGSLRGLLIEEARTNLALRSGDLSNAASWPVVNNVVALPTVTGNNTASPDGTTTAARIVYPAVSGASALSYVYQQITVTAATYGYSLYLRGNAGGEQVYLLASVGGSTFYSSSRLTLTTQWQRFSFVTPTLTAATWNFAVGTDLRDGTQAATPAQTVYAWGAQAEQGAFVTSHIPTAGATVTRAADTATTPVPSGFNGNTLSWAVEYIPAYVRVPDRILIAAGSTAFLFLSGAGNPAVYDGASQGAATFNAVTANVVGKMAMRLSAQTAAVCLNAGAVASSAGYTVGFSATTTVGFFSAASSTNGWLRRVQYWPRAISDTEMQQVTT
jgi:hypothetical protein